MWLIAVCFFRFVITGVYTKTNYFRRLRRSTRKTKQKDKSNSHFWARSKLLWSKGSQKTTLLSFRFNNLQISWIVSSLQTTIASFQVTVLNSSQSFPNAWNCWKVLCPWSSPLLCNFRCHGEFKKPKRLGRVGREKLNWRLLWSVILKKCRRKFMPFRYQWLFERKPSLSDQCLIFTRIIARDHRFRFSIINCGGPLSWFERYERRI